jgi:dTDP-3-amino-3,4,6-trideoxy-alpha-D-glucose transaminase
VEHAARDPLRAHLALHGIETGVHYPVPIHRSHAYRAMSIGKDPAPVATLLADRICSLPIHPDMSDSTAERIADLIANGPQV